MAKRIVPVRGKDGKFKGSRSLYSTKPPTSTPMSNAKHLHTVEPTSSDTMHNIKTNNSSPISKASNLFNNVQAEENVQKNVVIPKKIIKDVNKLLAQANTIEFVNNNPATAESGKTKITLQETLDDPKLLGNNCYSVSSIMTQKMPKARMVDVMFTKGTHFANMVVEDGQRWIIDWTLRQYGEDYPIPYVAPYDTWRKEVIERMHKLYNISLWH